MNALKIYLALPLPPKRDLLALSYSFSLSSAESLLRVNHLRHLSLDVMNRFMAGLVSLQLLMR